MSQNKTYLLTGASRGIGKGFVAALLQKPSTTVIAAVRDPSEGRQQALTSLPKAAGSKLILIKLDSSIESDASDAVASLEKEHGITSLDVVIANAGIAHSATSVSKTTPDATYDHFKINTIAPLLLFQATASLLKASKSGHPTFVAVSSLVGSIGGMEALAAAPSTLSPYGASKAALNWFVRRLHFEEPWLTSFVFHPGLVLTDMAAKALEGRDPKAYGAITVEESVTGMVKVIDSASREISGTFKNHDGTNLPW